MIRGRRSRFAAPGRRVLVSVSIGAAAALALAAILASPPAPSFASAVEDTSALATSTPSDTARDSAWVRDGDLLESDTAAGYPVRVGDRELYRITAADRARPAEERARTGSERFTRFARGNLPVDPIRVERRHYGADVHFGDFLLFTVFDVDTAGTGKDLESLARERAALVGAAVLEYREARSARSIVIGCVIAILATLGLFLVLRGIGGIYRRARGWAAAWVSSRDENIRRRTAAVLHGSHVLSVLNSLVDLARVLLVFLALFTYFRVVLDAFPWTSPVARNLDQMLVGPLQTVGRSVLDALPGLVFIAVVAVVVHYVLRFLHFLAVEIEAGHIEVAGFYIEWAKPTYNIARVLVIFFAVVVCYPYIPGSDTEAFKGVSIFLGVLLSLGSTSAVSNLIAGFVLTYMRAFRAGDIIQVDADRGTVTEVTVLATRIRTPKNEIVTIPNSTVLASRVINYSRMARDPGLVLHATVTVGYDAPWRQVHALLLRAAERTPGIKADPAPFVLQTAMEQVQVTYEINAYTDQPDRMLRIYSDLRQNIQDAFNEYGVQIMTPFYEGDKEAPLVVPKEKWYAAPAQAPRESDGASQHR